MLYAIYHSDTKVSLLCFDVFLAGPIFDTVGQSVKSVLSCYQICSNGFINRLSSINPVDCGIHKIKLCYWGLWGSEMAGRIVF